MEVRMPALDWATHHRLWVLGIGVGVLIVAVAAGLWFFALRSPGTQIDLRQALRLYRQGQHARSNGSPRLPPPGVYRYWTSGGEHLSLGGINRSFPGLTEMIVNDSNCATVKWAPFVEHIEGLVECPSVGGGIAMASAMSDEQIAGIRTVETVQCPTNAYLVPPEVSPGERWEATCHVPSGSVAFAGEVVGSAAVTVGRHKIPALHTRVTLFYSGDESGANPTDYWISMQNGVILRQRETVDVAQESGPLGSVRYTEEMALAIASTKPIR
jgi:hypothetical protein